MSHGIINTGKNMTIGILDSGLGGYSVYHALRAAYPNASFLFLADQANAPFGDKSKEAIFDIARDAPLDGRRPLRSPHPAPHHGGGRHPAGLVWDA